MSSSLAFSRGLATTTGVPSGPIVVRFLVAMSVFPQFSKETCCPGSQSQVTRKVWARFGEQGSWASGHEAAVAEGLGASLAAGGAEHLRRWRVSGRGWRQTGQYPGPATGATRGLGLGWTVSGEG